MISRDLLRSHEIEGLHVGCRNQLLPGWLNVDITERVSAVGTDVGTTGLRRLDSGAYFLRHDASQPFPLESGAFQKIFSEHMIEHLTLSHGAKWLTEMFRVLAPGGVLRLSTPDLGKYVEGYLDPESRFYKAHREQLMDEHFGVPARKSWMLNQIFMLWEHRWIYDFEEIIYAGQQAGFRRADIRRREYRLGALSGLDQPSRRDESLYVELTRDT